MKCPTDETTLVMSERSGIEIDYCPHVPRRVARPRRARQDHRPLPERTACRARTGRSPQPSYDRDDRSRDRDRDRDRDDRYETYQQPRQPGYQQGYPQQGGYKKKRKESWLSEIFD